MQGIRNKSTELKLIVFIFIISFLYSCSSIDLDIIQTGPYFPPKKNNDIKLYTDRNKVEKPFGAIAIIHSARFNCSNSKQKKILEASRKKASELGADGIIYYFDFGEKDPYALPGERCFFSGLAIKYVNYESKEYEKNLNLSSK